MAQAHLGHSSIQVTWWPVDIKHIGSLALVGGIGRDVDRCEWVAPVSGATPARVLGCLPLASKKGCQR